MASFGNALRERRVGLGLSQEALAEGIGASPRSVNRWEQGGAIPQPESRRRIAQFFGIQPGELGHLSHDQSAATSPALPAPWHVPVRRNPFFTGRDTVLERLHAALAPTEAAPQLQALTGLAGIGKTQAALEYAYRSADRYTAVFWLPADTREGCLAAFGNLANVLDLPTTGDPGVGRTRAAVRQWFRRHTGWLVVLDNLEDLGVLDELALLGRGSIVITTRAQATGASGGRIDLEPLSNDEAASFVLTRSKIVPRGGTLDQASVADRAAAETLVSRLGGMPLALDQAAAYLEETGCGLHTYLERFQTQQHVLLRRRGRLARDHPESVDATLNLAYRRIEQLNPAAGELLCLCAFLHPDLIPEETLSADPAALGPVLGPVAADPLRLDEALADLATLSLVRRDARAQALTLHRLVQDVVRATLSDEEQRCWAERAVAVVARALPGAEPHNFGQFVRFVPQALTAAELVSRWRIATPEAAQLLDRLGAHHQLAGHYAASLRLLRQAWSLCKHLVGRDHLDTAETLVHLAELALVLGQYRRAEILARAALGQRQAQLQASDLLVADTLGLLGRVCTERGRYHEAEPLLRRALGIQSRGLGERHPRVAETLSLLAEVAFMRGQYSETEQLLRRALAVNEAVLGRDHMVTGLLVEGLGTLYRYWGRDREAAIELRRALAILSGCLGSDHPTVMTVLNGLARAMLGQGQTSEAEPLARQALVGRESIFGPDHPKLAYSLQCLSEILLAQGRHAEAEPLARRGLAIRERIHAHQHQTVSISLDILAQVRQGLGDATEAMELYRRALAILENTVGSEHPRVVEMLSRYAGVLDMLQRHAEAASVRARAESIQLGSPVPAS